MCKYCNIDSKDCVIFFRPLTGEWYYNHRTNEYDEIAKEWLHEKIYIKYCPWCGEDLYKGDR